MYVHHILSQLVYLFIAVFDTYFSIQSRKRFCKHALLSGQKNILAVFGEGSFDEDLGESLGKIRVIP